MRGGPTADISVDSDISYLHLRAERSRRKTELSGAVHGRLRRRTAKLYRVEDEATARGFFDSSLYREISADRNAAAGTTAVLARGA
jgi:uncharacterized protein (DUF1330 family)